MEDLMFFVIKGYLPMKTIELMWLQRFSYRSYPKVVFHSIKVFVDEILLRLVEKTMVIYV
jgi:hypothetical protein